MKAKWIWALLIVVAGAALYGGKVMATPANGFTGTTLAKGTYGEISSHVHTIPASWNELIQTKGTSDLYVQQNTWDPAACGGCMPTTGWHTHPGPSLVIVTQGSVTVYEGNDRMCTSHVYTANTPDNAFVDPGDGHVHLIRNETGSVAKSVAVQLVPAGAVRRVDAPAPDTCGF